MIDGRSSIDYHEPTDPAPGIDDGAGHHDGSRAEADLSGDSRSRMHCDRQAAPVIQHLKSQPAAQSSFTHPDDDRVLRQKIRLDQTTVIADHGDAVNHRTRRVVIEKAGHVCSLARQNIGDYTPVTTAAEHHYMSRR